MWLNEAPACKPKRRQFDSQSGQKINESKSWFFEKINKIDETLTRFMQKKREDPNKIRSKRGEITTDTKVIQRIVRKYYEQLHALHANKLDNLDKI